MWQGPHTGLSSKTRPDEHPALPSRLSRAGDWQHSSRPLYGIGEPLPWLVMGLIWRTWFGTSGNKLCQRLRAQTPPPLPLLSSLPASSTGPDVMGQPSCEQGHPREGAAVMGGGVHLGGRCWISQAVDTPSTHPPTSHRLGRSLFVHSTRAVEFGAFVQIQGSDVP